MNLQTVSARRHYPQLDSIRTLAVLPVMIHHLWSASSPLAIEGVKLFFVISGFLITQILLASRDAAEENPRLRLQALGRFYARRFLRIFPLYYGVIFVALLIGLPPTREIIGWLLSYLLNFKMASQGWFVDTFAHFWSLCVEEQFYLLWPWVIFFIPKRLLFMAASFLVISALGFRILYIIGGFTLTTGIGTYILPFASMDSLGLGALLAMAASQLQVNKVTHGLRKAAIVAGSLLFLLLLQRKTAWGGWTLFTVQDTLEGLLFCALIWAAVSRVRGPLGALLSTPLLVFLGKISYGLYVYHPFMPRILAWLCGHLHLPAVKPFSFANFAVCSMLTVLIASISWYAYEAPLNSLKRYFMDPRPTTPNGARELAQADLLSAGMSASQITGEFGKSN